ncbi:hypothetical protein BG000_011432 [Podila horticola]|nr:hypothetical protein BG000_011432 [Podila horticola]
MTKKEERVLFTIDADGELWQPFRIEHNPFGFGTYIVIYSSNQRQTEEFFRSLQETDERGQGDSQTVANVRYYHSTFIQEVEGTLDKSGANTLMNGKSQEQMLEELRDLEQQLPEWEYQSACDSTLCGKTRYSNYATSIFFLALPSDLESWDDSNASTHQFRLYFMCDNQKYCSQKVMPQHVHLSSHPGYVIKRYQEFFQTYGDYVLRMLLMTKYGHSNSNYEIPPLDTLKILCGSDPNIVGSHLTKDTIGFLVDKAIKYLQELSPPKWKRNVALDYYQTAAIRTFLDVQHNHNSEGNLFRYIDESQCMSWICVAHVYQYFDKELLGKLIEFVQSHGGRVDVQQARLKIELLSPTEAELFRSLLTGCRYMFDLSINLRWKMTRLYVEELFAKIDNMRTVVLQVDTVIPDIDSSGYDRSLHYLFNNNYVDYEVYDRTDKVYFVTLLNYPQPQKKSILVDKFLLQSMDLAAQPLLGWVRLWDDLRAFGRMVSEAQGPLDWNRVATVLQSTLERHGFAGAKAVIMYSEEWSAAFDPKTGAIVKVHFQDTVCIESVLSAGTITSLNAHVDGLQFDKGFFRIVRANALMQELNISYPGHNELYYIEHVIRMWYSAAVSCRFTLTDRINGIHDRVVAQLTIKGSNCQSLGNGILDVDGSDIDGPISQQQALDEPLDIEFLRWDCDHVLPPLSDYSASLLDLATYRHPSVLTMYTLDVSRLSQIGLSSIQEVLGRSNLEQLHVVCTVVQELSHSSVLFLQRLIFSSPLVELHLRSVQLQDKRDWILVIDIVDLSLLQVLDLGEHGFMQLLSMPHVIDLFVSELEAIHLGADGPKLTLPSFTLDTVTLSQTRFEQVRMILSHCIVEKLVIKCDLIDLSMTDIGAKVLGSVQWTMLDSLTLSSDNINQWIQLLAKFDELRLKTLQIWGTKSVQQELSHESVLFVERLIGTNSRMKLHFKHVLLQDQQDWVVLVEKMDPSMLSYFDLGDGSYEQYISTPDAVDLIHSKRPQREDLVEIDWMAADNWLEQSEEEQEA